jgi:hypothetical protein
MKLGEVGVEYDDAGIVGVGGVVIEVHQQLAGVGLRVVDGDVAGVAAEQPRILVDVGKPGHVLHAGDLGFELAIAAVPPRNLSPLSQSKMTSAPLVVAKLSP